jgi:hypothetical protein
MSAVVDTGGPCAYGKDSAHARGLRYFLKCFGIFCCQIAHVHSASRMSTASLTPVTTTVNTTNMPPLIWHIHPRPIDLIQWNFNRVAENVD